MLRRLIGFALLLPLNCSWVNAAEIIHPETGFLVMAPDRGFLGNEEVRDVYQEFSELYTTALAFATEKKTAGNVMAGINELKASKVKNIRVLPLFISPSHAFYQKAVKVLMFQAWGVPIKLGETLNKSYLVEEVLKKRIAELSRNPSREVLVVVGSGAADRQRTVAIKTDLEALITQVNRSLKFSATEVVVLLDRIAGRAARTASFERVADRIKRYQSQGKRVVVIPFNVGWKATNMMSSWNRIKVQISKFDKIAANGKGLIPDKNIGIWLKKQANLRLPLSDDEIGVVLMPHGSDFNWNETIRDNLAPLLDRYKIEYAFSMADPKVIERAVRRLEKRGVRAIMLIRVYSLAASFREKTEYILGLNKTYEQAGKTQRIVSPAVFTTFGGSEDDPLVTEVMMERAKALSKNPRQETLILLAHGVGDDEDNRHWMNNLAIMAEQMRKNGGADFRDIQYYTWREDWPEKRQKAVAVIRQMIEAASRDGGTAILVPERTTG